jgi:hypothetical protein
VHEPLAVDKITVAPVSLSSSLKFGDIFAQNGVAGEIRETYFLNHS